MLTPPTERSMKASAGSSFRSQHSVATPVRSRFRTNAPLFSASISPIAARHSGEVLPMARFSTCHHSMAGVVQITHRADPSSVSLLSAIETSVESVRLETQQP